MRIRSLLLTPLLGLIAALLLVRESAAAESSAAKPQEARDTAKKSTDGSEVGAPVGGQLPARARPKQAAVDMMKAIYSSPLAVSGKVVDQDGRAIPAANVAIVVADKIWESGTRHERTTDAEGKFGISKVRGAGLYVEARKEGYYSGKESRKSLQSGELAAGGPATVLTLYKKGTLEPLLHHRAATVELRLDGTPVAYDFTTGRFVSPGEGLLSAQVWVESSMDQNFSWRYRLSVSGGGLVARTHEFAFAAPVEGYADVLENRIDAADPKWVGGFGGDFFIKLPDGKFGRFEMGLARGRDCFVLKIRALAINPSGSRNLEHDMK